MHQVQGIIATSKGSAYLQQLCKHWSHRLDVEFTPRRGRVVMPSGAIVNLEAEPATLAVIISASDNTQMLETQQVVMEHLDRFAFREGPLTPSWRDL